MTTLTDRIIRAAFDLGDFIAPPIRIPDPHARRRQETARDHDGEDPEFDTDFGGTYRGGRYDPAPAMPDDGLMVAALKAEIRDRDGTIGTLRRELVDVRAVLASAESERDRRAGELRDCRQAKAASELAAATALYRLRDELRRSESAPRGLGPARA